MSDDHTADRKISLRISKNGAQTFGDPDIRDLPETGDFKKRLVWTRKGQSRSFWGAIECTSPVGVTLIALSVDVDAGN